MLTLEGLTGSCVQRHHINIGTTFHSLDRSVPLQQYLRVVRDVPMESPRSHLRDLTSLSTSRVHLGLHAATQLRDRASPNHRLGEIRDSTPKPSLRTAVQDALCKRRPCTTTHADQGSSSCTPPRLLPEKPLANFITFLAASLEQGFL